MIAKLRHWIKLHVHNCRDSARDLRARPVGTLLTAAVIGIALALPASLNVLIKNGRNLAGGWESARDFSIYLVPGTPLESAEALSAELSARPDIDKVILLPADVALDEFRETSGFGATLDILDTNPLPHTLTVRPADSLDVARLEALAGELGQRPVVDLVQIDTAWVERLNALLDFLRRIVLIAAVLLGIGVIIIIGNTIRLDIQNRRDEIETLKLLGASDGFVRRPFLYLGLWYGALGGLLAVLLLIIGGWFLAGPVERLIGLYGAETKLLGTDALTAAGVVGAGVAAGWGGAWTAVTRHLAAIQPR